MHWDVGFLISAAWRHGVTSRIFGEPSGVWHDGGRPKAGNALKREFQVPQALPRPFGLV